MEKLFTVVGTLVILSGLAQGFSEEFLDIPFLEGIIGGIFPVLAGMLGFFFVSWKNSGETQE